MARLVKVSGYSRIRKVGARTLTITSVRPYVRARPGKKPRQQKEETMPAHLRHYEQDLGVSSEGTVVRFDLDQDPETVHLRIHVAGMEGPATVASGPEQVDLKLTELLDALALVRTRFLLVCNRRGWKVAQVERPSTTSG